MTTTDIRPVQLPPEKAEEANEALGRVRGYLFEHRDLAHIRVTVEDGDDRAVAFDGASGRAVLPLRPCKSQRIPECLGALRIHRATDQQRRLAIGDLKIDAAYILGWPALVAPGGHGKTQFAVQAQYLIDWFPSVELVICAGAGGSLALELSVGVSPFLSIRHSGSCRIHQCCEFDRRA